MQAVQYRKDIDALRGISVLLVVVFHSFPNIIPGGYIGVDVFFVISGYLITSIILNSIQKKDFSLVSFYQRRIRRLFPALITVLFTALIVGWLILFPDEYKQLAEHVSYSVIYLQNFILIGEIGYFDVESVYKPLLHLWTLSVEEQFYVIWPLLLLIILQQSYFKPVHIVLFVILSSFFCNIYFINSYAESVYFHTLTRIWQLATGSLLAMFLVDKDIKERKMLLVIGLALILSTAFFITDESIYPGWIAVLPTVGALLIIYGNVQFKQWGGLVKIGLISYPLYLWHWLALSFIYIYAGKRPGVFIIFATVILSFFLAYLTYKYIEKLRYVNGAQVPIILLIVMVSLGLAGVYVKNNDGLSKRGHLNYLNKFNIEFERTAIVDSLCEEYIEKLSGNDRLFDYCRASGLDLEKYIAVIGDSHAHVFYPGIVEQAKKRGYGVVLLANSSCPTLIGFSWGRNSKEVEYCKRKIEQIFSVIESDTRIEKVLMSTRGPVYIHGEVEGKFTSSSVNKSLSIIKDKKQTYNTYFNGFDNTLSRLQQIVHVKKVFYFLENPELDFLPKEVVARPFDIWGISTQNDAMDKKLYLLRMKRYRDLAKEHSRKYSISEIIDPMLYLCDSVKCYTYKNGNFLYADDDHLSVFGSRYIANLISGKIFYEQ